MAIIRCKGSKAKAVGLSGNPWRKVFSDVNWSWFKDSMTSCSKLAGPPVLPFHEKVMYLLYIFSFNYSIPKIIFFKWNWILPVPWPWLAPGGVGEFTLWRKLSSTPLIETNLFTLLEDILKIWRFSSSFYICIASNIFQYFDFFQHFVVRCDNILHFSSCSALWHWQSRLEALYIFSLFLFFVKTFF